jgi:C1A family cysteine protease
MDLSKYKFNLEKSPHDPRDFMLESIYPVEVEVELPEVWDLRPQMQPIRDQGNQGTCSAQTAAAMKEWQELVDVDYKSYFSPQFVYNLRENQGASGMYPRDTMEILYKIGIVAESDYPYYSNNPITDALKLRASVYKIQGYAQINTLEAVKRALFMNGPIYTAFPVYNPQKMEFWKQEYSNQQVLGGHAVCCAGYLKDSFIIRNSWSAEWGESGYCFYNFRDFGMHWEIWTAIDADSNPDTLKDKANTYKSEVKKRRNFFAKLFKRKNR